MRDNPLSRFPGICDFRAPHACQNERLPVNPQTLLAQSLAMRADLFTQRPGSRRRRHGYIPAVVTCGV
jgi:hypothetical protein